MSKRRVFTYTSIECCLLLAYRSRKDSLAIERCGVVCHGHPVPVGIAPHTLDLERHSASHYAEYITALKRRACPIKCRDVVFLRSASHHESFHGSFSIQRLRARCLLVRRMRFYGYVRASTGCSNVTLLRRKRFNNDNLRGGDARTQGSLNFEQCRGTGRFKILYFFKWQRMWRMELRNCRKIFLKNFVFGMFYRVKFLIEGKLELEFL